MTDTYQSQTENTPQPTYRSVRREPMMPSSTKAQEAYHAKAQAALREHLEQTLYHAGQALAWMKVIPMDSETKIEIQRFQVAANRMQGRVFPKPLVAPVGNPPPSRIIQIEDTA